MKKKQKSKGLLGKLLDVNERLDNVEDSVSTIDELKKLVETIRNEMSENKKEIKEDTVKQTTEFDNKYNTRFTEIDKKITFLSEICSKREAV